jgi:hypothetical protein
VEISTSNIVSPLSIGMPQMEQSSFATAAIPTFGSAVTRTADVYLTPNGGTYFNGAGVLTNAPANTPRLDHSPISPYASNGVLIEEGRTNLVAYSYGTTGENPGVGQITTYKTTSVPAPDNTTYFLKCAEGTTTSTAKSCRWTITMSASTTYTASAFFKADGRTAFTFLASDNSGGAIASTSIDLSAGTATQCSGGMASTSAIQQIGNGVYRVSLTFTTSSGATSGSYFDFRLSNVTPPSACSGTSYNGNGIDGIDIWGVQFEAGAFPTSYIPTSGSAVTRAADVFTVPVTATGAGGAWFTQGVGTLGANAVAPYLTTTTSGLTSIDDGTASNAVHVFLTTAAGKHNEVFNGGTQYGFAPPSNGTYTAGTLTHSAIAFAVNNTNIAWDSSVSTSNTSINIPASLTQLEIGHGRPSNTNYWNGWVNRIWYMPTRQPDASLPDYTR